MCVIARNDTALQDCTYAPVFNIVSTHHAASFRDAIQAVEHAGIAFSVVEPAEWLRRLDEARRQHSQHPSLKMLNLWQLSVG